MTRHNDPDLGVANRMTWTVTGIADTGAVQLRSPDRRQNAAVDADYVRQYLHLAYACTVHGVQGDTADHADLSDGTDAAAAYVALTRGRHTNTVHIVAGRSTKPASSGSAAAGRNRADLGLDQARAAAAGEARNYAATTDPQPRTVSAAPGRSHFADRMRQVTARLTDDRSGVDDAAAVTEERLPQQEWDDGIDEHQDAQTAVAVAAFLVAPTLWAVVGNTVFGANAQWLHIFHAYDRLSGDQPFADLPQTLTAIAAWVVLPTTIGVWRSLRREVK